MSRRFEIALVACHYDGFRARSTIPVVETASPVLDTIRQSGLERRGRILTALSWMDSSRNAFDVGQRVHREGI